MENKVNLVIHGVESSDEIPGIDRITDYVEISCAPDLDSMQRCLPKAEVLPVSYTHLTLPTKRIV